MAGKLGSSAQWVQSPCNWAEFIQTTCFTIRRCRFPVCVLPQGLGQINNSKLKYLPHLRPHLESSSRAQMGNIEATSEEGMASTHSMVGKNKSHPMKRSE